MKLGDYFGILRRFGANLRNWESWGLNGKSLNEEGLICKFWGAYLKFWNIDLGLASEFQKFEGRIANSEILKLG